MPELCIDCGEKAAVNGHRCWACSDKRRQKAACADCGQSVKRGTLRCRPCHLTRLNAEQRTSEGREAMSTKTRGIPKSAETRERMRQAQQARKPETRHDIGVFNRGKPGRTRLPVGTERIRRGRVIVKCENGKWRFRYQIRWEEKHGSIPPGYMIHHINEDPMDDSDANLQLMTKAEHTRLHQIHRTSNTDIAKRKREAKRMTRARNTILNSINDADIRAQVESLLTQSKSKKE